MSDKKHEPTVYSIWLNKVIEGMNANIPEDGKKYTPYRLAVDAKVNQPTLSRIISGESKNPKRATIRKLAETLGVASPDDSVIPIGQGVETNTAMPITPAIGGPSPVVIYEIDQNRLEVAIELLDEDVQDWSSKPTINRARLLMMFYEQANKKEK